MDPGELLTRWTVRLAVALCALSLALRARRRQSWARLAWTIGYGAFLLHVACAFQFYHHWSHRAAYEDTARRTAEVVGLAWGGGLYANYAFALVWGADVAWWWAAARTYVRRSWAVEAAVQGFLAFMMLNATVVFGVGLIRWMGLAICLALAVVFGLTRWRAEGREASARQ